jgi:hypothetical protein
MTKGGNFPFLSFSVGESVPFLYLFCHIMYCHIVSILCRNNDDIDTDLGEVGLIDTLGVNCRVDEKSIRGANR